MTLDKCLTFSRVKLGLRQPAVNLELPPASHGLVIDSPAQAQSFIELASGIGIPPSGKVRIGELAPGQSPSLRAQIGTLLPSEPPLDKKLSTPKVENFVDTVRQLRKRHSTSEVAPHLHSSALLSPRILALSPQELSASERRRVALGLALEISKPCALFLYDPLDDLDEEAVNFVMNSLVKSTEDGALVVCVTPTHVGATRLSNHVISLGRAHHPPPSSPVRYLYRGERPREIAARLTENHHILATRLNPHQTQELVIESNDEDAAALALNEAIVASQCEIFELVRLANSPSIKRGLER